MNLPSKSTYGFKKNRKFREFLEILMRRLRLKIGNIGKSKIPLTQELLRVPIIYVFGLSEVVLNHVYVGDI